MFSTIRDKFLNVTKTVPLFSSSNSDKDHVQCQVDLDAGSDTLSHFQTQWEIIHATNEENAKKAEEAAGAIAKITQKINREKESISVMTHLLTNSNLKLNISNCTKQIEQLYQSFNEVEEGLLQLEDLIDTIEFENMKKQHRYHLNQYQVRKEESVKALETSLKEKHQKVVAEVEQKKKKELEERRKVFDEAFKTDLEIFKNSGSIPKLDLPQKQPSALLEEIEVDFDQQELDQFLEDNPSQ